MKNRNPKPINPYNQERSEEQETLIPIYLCKSEKQVILQSIYLCKYNHNHIPIYPKSYTQKKKVKNRKAKWPYNHVNAMKLWSEEQKSKTLWREKNSIPLTHMPRRKKVKNRRAKSPYAHVKAKELESEEQKIKTHVP